MIKIKMLKNSTGSIDGKKVTAFYEGNIYSIPEKLADIFVRQIQVAKYFVEEKMEEILPNNKMMNTSDYKNKSFKWKKDKRK